MKPNESKLGIKQSYDNTNSDSYSPAFYTCIQLNEKKNEIKHVKSKVNKAK